MSYSTAGRNPTLFLLLVGTALPFATILFAYCAVCREVRRTGRETRKSVRGGGAEPRLSVGMRTTSVAR